MLPREIDKQLWKEWRSQISLQYPFERELVERINLALGGSLNSIIDIGRVNCPYCGRQLEQKKNLSPKCSQCGSEDMECTNHAIASLKYGIVWPPPPIEEGSC